PNRTLSATPLIKHVSHRLTLNVSVANAATPGTVATEAPYDLAYGTYGVYDSTGEVINRATVATQGASGAAGGFLSGDTATLNHYNSAGTLVDAVSISTAGMTARVAGDITGNTASTGNTFLKGWTMVQGDVGEMVVAATTTAGNRNVGVTLLLSARGN